VQEKKLRMMMVKAMTHSRRTMVFKERRKWRRRRRRWELHR
jgi:hypothetical protein